MANLPESSCSTPRAGARGSHKRDRGITAPHQSNTRPSVYGARGCGQGERAFSPRSRIVKMTSCRSFRLLAATFAEIPHNCPMCRIGYNRQLLRHLHMTLPKLSKSSCENLFNSVPVVLVHRMRQTSFRYILASFPSMNLARYRVRVPLLFFFK